MTKWLIAVVIMLLPINAAKAETAFIRDLSNQYFLKINSDGSTNTDASCTQGTSPWVTNISQFGGNNIVTGIGISGNGIPRVTVSSDSNIGRTWTTSSATDSMSCVQETSPWLTSRNWTLSNSTDSVNAVQSGIWTVQQGNAPWSVSQGTSPWLTSRNWTLSNSTDSVNAVQSGIWTTGRTWNLSYGIDSVTSFQGTSPWVTNISQFGGNNVVTGTGVSGNGVPRVTVANDSQVKIWDGTDNVGPNQSGNSIFWMPVVAAPVDGYKASYSFSVFGLSVAPAPTDVITIQGSATKTVKITRIDFSNTQNVATSNDILLILRSSADSGGTSSTVMGVAHDQNNAAATAVVKQYTVNPTSLGTQIGIFRANKVFGSTKTTSGTDQVWEFGNRPSQEIVLRGASQFLVINLDAQAFVGSSIDVNIEVTEE